MAGQQIQYEVQSGDSLQSIARQFYAGNMEAWRRIYDLNSETLGPNPNDPPVGLTLHIPTDEPVYTMQEGDTIASIVEPFHLGAHAVERVYAANRWRYPDWTDPAQVRPGMVLHIPVQEVEYRWRDRDTPAHVAEIFYGDAGEAERIIAANPDRLSPAPDDHPDNPLSAASYPVIIP